MPRNSSTTWEDTNIKSSPLKITFFDALPYGIVLVLNALGMPCIVNYFNDDLKLVQIDPY